MNAQITHIQVQNWTKWIYYVLNTHQTHKTHCVHDLFNVSTNLATILCLPRTRIRKTQFAMYVFDTHVTLIRGQSNQIWYQLVDFKQGYNEAV